jgi:N-acetylmuramoyl-L-alanine amidase
MIYKIKIAFFTITIFSIINVFGQTNQKKFTVVLDAGHGGKDTGNKHNGFVEKDIALNTTLKVGAILESLNDVKVVFTRKSDVFIELVDRPNIANKLGANLFISIHCNAAENHTAFGTETFVMGLARSKMNLEVAKRENSVILLEDNYKVKYKGFNPNNPESFLGIKIKVEENLNNSISLASKVQDNFTNILNRNSRGVKQQPLWVLDASTMPGILIELGFLSNEDEGAFLNTEDGQIQMAEQIAKAILGYKKEYYDSDDSNDLEIEINTPKNNSVNQDIKNSIVGEQNINTTSTTYKIQLCASNKKVGIEPKNFKGLKDISFEKTGSLYKYYAGNETDSTEIQSLLKTAKAKGYKSAFIVTFVDGKKQ